MADGEYPLYSIKLTLKNGKKEFEYGKDTSDVVYNIEKLFRCAACVRCCSGHYRGDHRTASVHRAGAGFRSGPGAGYLHGDRSWFCNFIFRRKSGSDRRPDSSICYDRCRHRSKERSGGSGCRYDHGRYYSCHYGLLSVWLSDQIHSVYDNDRLYFRNCRYHCDRSAEGFLRCYIPCRYGNDRNDAEAQGLCSRFRKL